MSKRIVFELQRGGNGLAGDAVRASVLALGLGLMAGAAQAQSGTPDAQVEANVLKALASAPELANEGITTRTVYGIVTLSGNVQSEDLRRRAENLAAGSSGVVKVVDELQLGAGSSAIATPTAGQPGPGMVLQSDGTYAAAPVDGNQPVPGSAPAEMAQRNNPDADQQLDQPQMQNPQGDSGGYASGQTSSSQTGSGQSGSGQTQPPYGQGPYGRRPMGAPGYSQNGQAPNGYPQGGYPQNPEHQVYGGQAAGQSVIVPTGTMVRVRVNRTLSSNRTDPGTMFDGIVVNDVVAGGAVAIPRGASVQGRVIDAKSSGVLKGRGEISVELISVTLAGQVYPLKCDPFSAHGGDKTIETVNKTAGFGAVGAVFGALAGGGVGAAVGGGIGAAAGLGSSAASGNGQVVIPSEGVLTFHLAQAATVATVSEQEMQRLAYGVQPGADQRNLRRRAYPNVYVGPAYYPGYYPYNYRPYPY